MNIVWVPDQDEASDAEITDWKTEAIPAFPEDDKLPDEYFILRVEPVIDGHRFEDGGAIVPDDYPYRFVVDYHEDAVSAPYEAVSTGVGTSLEDAKRQAIRALLDIDARPVEFAWVDTLARVFVRVNLRTSTIDHVHLQPYQQTPTAHGAGASLIEAMDNPLNPDEAEAAVAIVDENTWPPLEVLPDSVTWEG